MERLRKIRTKEQYDQANTRLEALLNRHFKARRLTAEERNNEVDHLSSLILDYESRHYGRTYDAPNLTQ